MNLCVDCGNTCIKFGFYETNKLVKQFTLKTIKDKTSDEYKLTIKELLDGVTTIERAIISSVVPKLTNELVRCVRDLFSIEPLVLNNNLKTRIPIKIDNPAELGSDMLAGAVAAKEKYGYPTVVADLGTATKIYVIDKNGAICGCIITCGIESQHNQLVQSASQLMEVPLEAPSKIIGKNTKTSIQSGIIYGQAYMVSEFARRMEKELGYELKRVLTGGFASLVKDQIVCFNYEETLALDGLNLILGFNL